MPLSRRLFTLFPFPFAILAQGRAAGRALAARVRRDEGAPVRRRRQLVRPLRDFAGPPGGGRRAQRVLGRTGPPRRFLRACEGQKLVKSSFLLPQRAFV